MPRSFLQSFFSVFTQISPLFEMFGWKIRVRKKPFGGECGYSAGSTSFTRKTPPSKGVESGREKA